MPPQQQQTEAEAFVEEHRKKPTMTVFNAVCFAVLMDHHKEGVEEAHPEYVEEKLDMLEKCSAPTAFSQLDARNQHRVLEWCHKWKISLDFLSPN